MSENSSHHRHHRHHQEDYASRFKRKSLQSSAIRRKVDKFLKIALCIVAVIMMLFVVYVYQQ